MATIEIVCTQCHGTGVDRDASPEGYGTLCKKCQGTGKTTDELFAGRVDAEDLRFVRFTIHKKDPEKKGGDLLDFRQVDIPYGDFLAGKRPEPKEDDLEKY